MALPARPRAARRAPRRRSSASTTSPPSPRPRPSTCCFERNVDAVRLGAGAPRTCSRCGSRRTRSCATWSGSWSGRCSRSAAGAARSTTSRPCSTARRATRRRDRAAARALPGGGPLLGKSVAARPRARVAPRLAGAAGEVHRRPRREHHGLAVGVLDPRPGDRQRAPGVLDLGAGGQIAAVAGDRSQVVGLQVERRRSPFPPGAVVWTAISIAVSASITSSRPEAPGRALEPLGAGMRRSRCPRRTSVGRSR